MQRSVINKVWFHKGSIFVIRWQFKYMGCSTNPNYEEQKKLKGRKVLMEKEKKLEVDECIFYHSCIGPQG